MNCVEARRAVQQPAGVIGEYLGPIHEGYMLSIQKVSEQLAISRSLVYAEIHAGNLRAHCFGKRTYRVSEEDLASYKEQHGHIAKLPKEITSPAAAAPRGPKEFKHLNVTPRPSSRNRQDAVGPSEDTSLLSKSRNAPAGGSSS